MFDILILVSLAKIISYKFPQYRNILVMRTLIISAVIKILVMFLYSGRGSRDYWLFDKSYMAESEIKKAKYIVKHFGAFYFIWRPYYYLLTNNRKSNAPLSMRLIEVNEDLQKCKSDSESCLDALLVTKTIIYSGVKDKKTKDTAKEILINGIEQRTLRNVERSCRNIEKILGLFSIYKHVKSVDKGYYSLLEDYHELDIKKDFFEKCYEPNSISLISYYEEKMDFESLFQIGNKVCPLRKERSRCGVVIYALRDAYKKAEGNSAILTKKSLPSKMLKVCKLSTNDCDKILASIKI